MRKWLFAPLSILACALLLTACSGKDPTTQGGVWNQSNWNQATWR